MTLEEIIESCEQMQIEGKPHAKDTVITLHALASRLMRLRELEELETMTLEQEAEREELIWSDLP